ncbi:MAG: DUF4383 domain-containing protein [Armatimonadetes bacterium]|nr:DUF4383 domain-containing protein [Armatimonadota bacterium]
MAKMYCQVVGVVLIVLGIIGFLTNELITLQFVPVHNWIHLITGVILAYLGFTGTSVKVGAQVFGVIYTIVGVVGFFGGGTFPVLNFPVSTLYNLVHLVIGLWGLWAGFGAKEAATA